MSTKRPHTSQGMAIILRTMTASAAYVKAEQDAKARAYAIYKAKLAAAAERKRGATHAA